MILGIFASLGGETTNDEKTDGASSCQRPGDAWLATLRSGFYRHYRDAPMLVLGYVEADTSDGKAYYVAVMVAGVDGVALLRLGIVSVGQARARLYSPAAAGGTPEGHGKP